MKYRNLQLVTVDDEDYRNFGAERRLESMKFRKKKERAATDLLGDVVEDAVRAVVERTGTLDDRRIWKYERLKQNRYEEEYREMDFVCRLEDDALIFGEVKSSNRASALTKAKSQVRKNLDLAVRAERRACGVIVICGTGDEFTERAEQLLELPAMFDAGGEEILVLRIPIPSLRGQVDGELGAKWDELQQRVDDERQEAERIQAARQALIDEGIDEEDWPEDLRRPKPEEWEQAEVRKYGGEEKMESEMERKLREAMKKAEDRGGESTVSQSVDFARGDLDVLQNDSEAASDAVPRIPWWRRWFEKLFG